MVLAGLALTSRCLPYGSDADAEPLLMSALRAGTMGERAGDVVGDMTEMRERGGEDEPCKKCGRAYDPFPCSRSLSLEVQISWSSHPLLFRSAHAACQCDG